MPVIPIRRFVRLGDFMAANDVIIEKVKARPDESGYAESVDACRQTLFENAIGP